MLRPVAFAIGLALCSLSGWSSAHAHPSSILWKIGKSPAAAKVIDNLISRPALAEKALETLKQLKGLMREYETDAVQAVLSENHIRTYWWCSPDKIGMATMTPDRWTARPRGTSLPNAKCVRI
jgi:hypothetical protein